MTRRQFGAAVAIGLVGSYCIMSGIILSGPSPCVHPPLVTPKVYTLSGCEIANVEASDGIPSRVVYSCGEGVVNLEMSK